MNNIYDIFEEYEVKLVKKEKYISWRDFEFKLREASNVDENRKYLTVKQIIKAFYHADKYRDICYEYAKLYTSAEYHSLIMDFEGYKS